MRNIGIIGLKNILFEESYWAQRAWIRLSKDTDIPEIHVEKARTEWNTMHNILRRAGLLSEYKSYCSEHGLTDVLT